MPLTHFRRWRTPAHALSSHPATMGTFTGVFLVGHILLALASVFGRVVPPTNIDPAPDWIEDGLRFAADMRWATLHLAAILLLMFALVLHHNRFFLAIACWFSGTIWLIQAVLLAMWAGWSTPPAAFTAPVCSGMVGVLAWIVGGAWDWSLDRGDGTDED